MQRDETRVLGAVVMRLDTSVAAFADQMRATHSQITQVWTRVRSSKAKSRSWLRLADEAVICVNDYLRALQKGPLGIVRRGKFHVDLATAQLSAAAV